MLKLLKISLGSAISILFANMLGLKSSGSAGIITLLTIHDTSKETIVVSGKRLAAFAIGTSFSSIIFHIFGFHPIAFAVFLLLFISCCQAFKLEEGIATNAVLATHYLAAGEMNLPLIANELLLLLIGAGIGTLLNLYMPGKAKEIRTTQTTLESAFKKVLLEMSLFLKKENKEDFGEQNLDKLLSDIMAGEKQAYNYMQNTFFQESKYFIEYMEMRHQQCIVLKEIYKKILKLTAVIPQSIQVSDFICHISETFNESNNAKDLLSGLDELILEMKNSTLPTSRKEFENRAILYTILTDLHYFLQLKKDFSDCMTEEQVQKYWETE